MPRIITALFAALCLCFGLVTIAMAESGAPQAYEVQKTDAEWRTDLTAQQYNILRGHGTERPHSSSLLKEKRHGVFVCAACGHEVFLSETKYESGTGWPSFYQPASQSAVGTSTDYKLGYPRTEVHCARCGGHLGHVFNDGPQPTGLRYCINGAALNFTPRP